MFVFLWLLMGVSGAALATSRMHSLGHRFPRDFGDYFGMAYTIIAGPMGLIGGALFFFLN